MPRISNRRYVLAAWVWVLLLAGLPTSGAGQEPLSSAQKQEFLRTAEVVASRMIGTGVTEPWRLTLSDGTLTHDAVFQAVERRRESENLGRRTEIKFADSYKFNIAAYKLSILLGLDDMIPVTVERRWRGKDGALTWWVDDVRMDEWVRNRQGIRPPDTDAWLEEIHRMYVFEQLIYDTDRNDGNLLYDHDWKLWMIDFTRAFRIWPEIREKEDLIRCDRELYERLAQLSEPLLNDTLKPHLTDAEIRGLIERRDKIAAYFDEMIARKGEADVLY